jgi:hypothetical protein
MTHLEIIKKAYDKCGIEYRVFRCEESPEYEYLVLVGCHGDEYENLTSDEATRKAGDFMEFENGQIASY